MVDVLQCPPTLSGHFPAAPRDSCPRLTQSPPRRTPTCPLPSKHAHPSAAANSDGPAFGTPSPGTALVSPSPRPPLQEALASFTPGSSSPRTPPWTGKSARVQSGSQGPGLFPASIAHFNVPKPSKDTAPDKLAPHPSPRPRPSPGGPEGREWHRTNQGVSGTSLESVEHTCPIPDFGAQAVGPSFHICYTHSIFPHP